MGIKTYRPYTPSRRQMTGSDFSEITKTTPEKSLLAPKSRQAGRNIKEKSQLDTAEAELRKNIELSTSREEKTISTQLYLVSNMIQTEQLILL